MNCLYFTLLTHHVWTYHFHLSLPLPTPFFQSSLENQPPHPLDDFHSLVYTLAYLYYGRAHSYWNHYDKKKEEHDKQKVMFVLSPQLLFNPIVLYSFTKIISEEKRKPENCANIFQRERPRTNEQSDQTVARPVDFPVLTAFAKAIFEAKPSDISDPSL